MRFSIFAGRNFKEIIREPLSIIMGIAFPVFLIIALSLMNQNIKGMADIFQIQNFAPSMAIFGLAFWGMFVGTLMSTDRDSSFLARLLASPMKGVDYILGYSLPVILLTVLQAICCFAVASIFGLKWNTEIFAAILVMIPVAVLFISFGLFMGSVLPSNSAVSGFGTILVNCAVFLGGAVLPIEVIGGAFEKICNLLPFVHAVNAVQDAVMGNYSELPAQLAWVLGYALVLIIPSVIIFKKRMKE